MPIYVYSCEQGHKTEILLHPTEERKDSLVCRCGRAAPRDFRAEHEPVERIFRPFFLHAARRWVRSPSEVWDVDRDMEKKGFTWTGLERGG